MIQKPRGTRDFLPDEMEARRSIEAKMREAVRRFGYREVCTPEFEELELFTLRSGEGIMQEMYVFEDKGGRKLALRPEITAAVIRMYINEAKVAPKPLRWCYFADCFRYERPQKGRYRQFWQFGAELIGADTALADAEVIMLAAEALNATGVTWELKVGHLAFMKNLLADLDPAAQRRVMAHLDKKDFEGLAETLAGMRKSGLNDSLTALVECRTLAEAFEIAGTIPEKERVEQTMGILDASGVRYSLNFGIARGLDYYTGMVFEGFAENLGAENQILGGGAYRLAHLFGGDDVASCGFAIGFDRVMVSLGEVFAAKDTIAGIVCTDEGRSFALSVAREFRAAGIRAEMDLMGRGLGAQLAHASKTADFAVVIGKREADAGQVTLKNLHSGEQKTLDPAAAIAEVKAHGAR
ncbi:histidyl-tRNA synthetase [Methanoregula boonei 6A8]|uniref:Histidine--tRNA ligase n=1 Tax=Methanoregula boonei (strain DSM 21154 / JCM 14090 / 6A8) TaxID=456442 RepID=SYH_METB6|nr:histidine--tRNA ligase [Methanoregula boonei]A7I940.1 RecName: Full=Histidine--tRNA ligase; AltName: Full=Histidyl-tRNA synthetase; Short=HisRS [Methanoregula boonei 6A8]ABS56251.1 histidyl-tRNA synthetase [Methanoregula boonei 6A8]